MFDRHDTAFFFRFSAQGARRFRKTWAWAAPVVAGAFVLAAPQGISARNLITAVLVVAGVWILSFAIERLNDAVADLNSDPD